MLMRLVLLAVAGGAGTLARFGLAGLVQRATGAGFPWGTAAVNVVGCLAFGAVWAIGGERLAIGAETRNIVLIGFLGAFTTFSAFMYETGQLLVNSQWLLAGGNLLLQNALGMTAFFLGLALGRVM
jgi:CrcB protein